YCRRRVRLHGCRRARLQRPERRCRCPPTVGVGASRRVGDGTAAGTVATDGCPVGRSVGGGASVAPCCSGLPSRNRVQLWRTPRNRRKVLVVRLVALDSDQTRIWCQRPDPYRRAEIRTSP